MHDIVYYDCGCHGYENDLAYCKKHKGEPMKEQVVDLEYEEKIKKEKEREPLISPQISRLPKDSLYEICQVFQAVSEGQDPKYKEDDWRNGVNWKKNYNSLQRHLMDWYEGKDFDEETGLLTLAHAGCRILMALEMQLKNIGDDDRLNK